MATITITTTTADDQRVAPAFGNYLGLPGNANTAQVKSAIIDFVKNVVFSYEKRQAEITADAGVTPISPT